MRRDLFIVGARLLGIWQLVGAVNSLAVLISTWFAYTRRLPTNLEYNLEYNALRFIVELVVGLYLIFRTYRLFDFFDRLKPEEESAEPAGTE